jgi:RHS repeat-associated protein
MHQPILQPLPPLTVFSPFGVVLEGRTFSSQEYRYGFQAQEQDDELWEGAVNYKYRVEDPRLGRFFSVDPIYCKFPHNSPYAFSENRLIDAIEFEGLECVMINITTRLTVPLATVAGCVGIGIDGSGTVFVYKGWSLGVAVGLYAGIGGTAQFFPTGSVESCIGHGFSVGVSVAFEVGASFELPFSVVQNQAGLPSGIKVGEALPVLPGIGAGAEVHAEYDKTELIGKYDLFNLPDDMYDQLSGILDLTKEHYESFMASLRKASNELNGSNDEGDRDAIKNMPNIQTLGNIQFDSNLARNCGDHLIVRDINSGNDFGVVRKENGCYEFYGENTKVN